MGSTYGPGSASSIFPQDTVLASAFIQSGATRTWEPGEEAVYTESHQDSGSDAFLHARQNLFLVRNSKFINPVSGPYWGRSCSSVQRLHYLLNGVLMNLRTRTQASTGNDSSFGRVTLFFQKPSSEVRQA